jgi:hypothetical protein
MDNNHPIIKAFDWTPAKRKAAFLLAVGQDPKTIIAKKVEAHPKTISYWGKHPEFQRQVVEFREKILLTTDEQLTRTLSEQVLNMRGALNIKLNSLAELKKIPTERLLAEYRKFIETIFKVNKGGDVTHHTGELNVNYGGKIRQGSGVHGDRRRRPGLPRRRKMKVGLNIRQAIMAEAAGTLRKAADLGDGDLGQFAFMRQNSPVNNDSSAPQLTNIENDNIHGANQERRGANTDGNAMDAIGKNRMEEQLLRNQLAAMSKAIVIIAAKKKIKPKEVGEDDLPKGTLKYDEVPNVNEQNMVGIGGAGRAECTVPMNMGGGMLPNHVMGTEILRASVDALNRAKDGEKTRDKEDPSLRGSRELKLA